MISGSSTVFVEMTTSVTGGMVSVWTTVLVAGTRVCVAVSNIVTTSCGGDAFAAVAAAPPSTGTTEYVALLAKGSTGTTFRGVNGSDELNKKSDDKAKSDVFEVLRRMVIGNSLEEERTEEDLRSSRDTFRDSKWRKKV